jgi:hypothetical protein
MRFTPRIDSDIRRLQVAVDDTLQMGGIYRVADLPEQAQDSTHRKGAIPDKLIQRLAVDVVHHIVKASGGDTRIMDGDDIGVMELPQNLHFAIETRSIHGPGEGTLLHDLDGDPAMDSLLDRFVDDRLQGHRSHEDSADERTAAGIGVTRARGRKSHPSRPAERNAIGSRSRPSEQFVPQEAVQVAAGGTPVPPEVG